jgi:hypothetical protein
MMDVPSTFQMLAEFQPRTQDLDLAGPFFRILHRVAAA